MRLGFRAPVARPKSVSLTCPDPSTRKFCISDVNRLTKRNLTRMRHLWFKIAVDITKLVQFCDRSEHFTYVESGVFFFEDT